VTDTSPAATVNLHGVVPVSVSPPARATVTSAPTGRVVNVISNGRGVSTKRFSNR
jgi:hypothetical protein